MTRLRPKISVGSVLLENAPEHLKLIGLIAVNQAHLDRTLCRLISALAGLDSGAPHQLLSKSSTNARRGRLLANLARRQSLPREGRRQLEACLDRVEQCAQRQDAMSNSAYGVGQNGLVLTPSSDSCGKIVPFPREKLRKLADDIAECTEELERLAVTLRRDADAPQYSWNGDATRSLPT